MISRAIAIAAVWECQRCGSSTAGGALLVADSPAHEIAPGQEAGIQPLDASVPSPTIDERLLRCPSCGSRKVEIPIEILDTKRLR